MSASGFMIKINYARSILSDFFLIYLAAYSQVSVIIEGTTSLMQCYLLRFINFQPEGQQGPHEETHPSI